MISSLLREYNYNLIQKNNSLNKTDEEDSDESVEYVTLIDHATGKPKRVKKVKGV